MQPNLPSAPLTVSQLNRQVKQLLESQYPSVPVQGEISTLSRPASGHIYFTLKDQNAQIRCAMFKGSLVRNKYLPKQGDEVVAFGRLSLYEGRGDYQLIVSAMQPKGEGALQAAFFQMKERLAAEGLFDEAWKKPLPKHISTVGIVTSSTGAALHDILTVLNRRFPALKIILYPSQVQGKEATQTIVNAIETANLRNEVDVLVVGRGGGSLEDLWCFNTEPVARAVFASDLPIISAVGHEVDVSIADFVADLRAATPSQAAEMISPDQFEIMQRIDQGEQRLALALKRQLEFARHRLEGLRRQLKNPAEKVQAWREKLITLEARLTAAVSHPLKQKFERVAYLSQRLSLSSPANHIKQDRQALLILSNRLTNTIRSTIDSKKAEFHQSLSTLNVLSPLSTLERGYSISKDEDGRVIQQASQVKKGQSMETMVRQGTIISTVVEVKNPND